MKKILFSILLFMMFIPFVVNAETCDTDKISISSITMESKSKGVEELNKATANGKNLNLNLSMSEVGDNITYKIVVNNDSTEDYELDKTSLSSNSDYINYTFESEDNSNVVKAGEVKSVYLKVNYANEVPDELFEDGSYNDNKLMVFNFFTQGITKNPNTGIQAYILILSIVLIVSFITFVIVRKKKYAALIVSIIIIIIPISVYALCNCEIKISSNVRIKNVTMFDKGLVVNEKMKNLANGLNNIKIFERSNTLPEEIKQDIDNILSQYGDSFEENIINIDNILSRTNSFALIYGWYDENNKTLYYFSEDDDVFLNPDSSYMFEELEYLGYTPGLRNVITTRVTNMSYMFSNTGGRINPSMEGYDVEIGKDISNWDTSKVTNMSHMFDNFAWNENEIEWDMSNWDTSKVTDMSYMFNAATSNLRTFNLDLSNWDTSKVTNMSYMFAGTSCFSTYWSLGDLSNWDTSKVTNMSHMFDQGIFGEGTYAQTIYIGDLSNWDTSKVTNMSYMFSESGFNAIKWKIGDLSNWDTSKVTDMGAMFSGAGYNSNEWVSLGTFDIYADDIAGMFNGCKKSKVTLNIHKKPSRYKVSDTYFEIFAGAAIDTDSFIKVNYTTEVDNIDEIIATKSNNSNVYKGDLLN